MVAFSSTKALIDAYNNGLDGVRFDERQTDEILASMPKPLFSQAADSTIKDSGKGKLALPYKFVKEFDLKFGEDENQTTGDCTSMGTRNGCTISLVSDIKSRFEAEKYPGRLATETIYGARRHSGEGMAVIFAVEYLKKHGIALRKKYGKYDLTKYDSRIGTRWGSTGVPKEVTDETKENTISDFALITTVQEARDSLYNGYGLTVGSNYGFTNKRDKNGISRQSGSWGHCMAWIGMDDTRQRSDELLFLIQNSWGPNWNGGPLILGQPLGSFWITETDAQGMLNQKQAYAISNVNGFPSRDIDWSFLDDVL
jgi:hypothetical protein